MAKMWRRTAENSEPDDYEYPYENPPTERYRRPKVEASHYDRDLLEDFGEDDDDEDSSAVDELLERVKKGKYKPKKSDHWTLHVAYSLIQNRGR